MVLYFHVYQQFYYSATEKILQKCRQIVDIKKDDGFSAIHLAALNGHRDVTFSLLTLVSGSLSNVKVKQITEYVCSD